MSDFLRDGDELDRLLTRVSENVERTERAAADAANDAAAAVEQRVATQSAGAARSAHEALASASGASTGALASAQALYTLLAALPAGSYETYVDEEARAAASPANDTFAHVVSTGVWYQRQGGEWAILRDETAERSAYLTAHESDLDAHGLEKARQRIVATERESARAPLWRELRSYDFRASLPAAWRGSGVVVGGTDGARSPDASTGTVYGAFEQNIFPTATTPQRIVAQVRRSVGGAAPAFGVMLCVASPADYLLLQMDTSGLTAYNVAGGVFTLIGGIVGVAVTEQWQEIEFVTTTTEAHVYASGVYAGTISHFVQGAGWGARLLGSAQVQRLTVLSPVVAAAPPTRRLRIASNGRSAAPMPPTSNLLSGGARLTYPPLQEGRPSRPVSYAPHRSTWDLP